jgi:hypothetical protein
MIEEEL